MENSLQIIKYRINTRPPPIPLIGIDPPKESKTETHTDTCTPVFIAMLFIIVKRWKQPKCLSRDERTNKMWCVCATEYSSPIKRNEALIHNTTWKNLET